MAKQSKGRKVGNKKKQPSMQRYKLVNRAATNKQRAIARHKRDMQDKADNPPKVPRGTARAQRRAKEFFGPVADIVVRPPTPLESVAA